MAIQTPQGFTTILGSSRVTLAVLGIQSPRVTNTTRSSRERVRCSYLKVAHSRELKSSLKNKIQEWSLGGEERTQELNLRSVFHFLWVGNGLRGRWESIYSSDIKKSRWEIFHRQVRWTSLESSENSLDAGQGPDKSGRGLWSPVGASGIRSQTG
jgi:hypothetical protein